MANPKYKTSKCKTRRRRSHLALKTVSLSECPHCHKPKLSHHACLNKECNLYKGKKVLGEKKAKK